MYIDFPFFFFFFWSGGIFSVLFFSISIFIHKDSSTSKLLLGVSGRVQLSSRRTEGRLCSWFDSVATAPHKEFATICSEGFRGQLWFNNWSFYPNWRLIRERCCQALWKKNKRKEILFCQLLAKSHSRMLWSLLWPMNKCRRETGSVELLTRALKD